MAPPCPGRREAPQSRGLLDVTGGTRETTQGNGPTPTLSPSTAHTPTISATTTTTTITPTAVASRFHRCTEISFR